MTRLLCLLLLTLPGVVLAADNDVVFRSDVSLVRVDAQVVDRGNRAITGLRAEDFVLHEEGRPMQVSNFASENMPVDVLLLLDVSASMRPHVQHIADASHQAMRVLRDQDRVGIMVFDRSTRIRLRFRNNPQDAERELEALLRHESFNGGTDITRGLLDAADYVRQEGRREARKAIVILTDDQTEMNRDEEAVSRALTRADAVLCALIAPDAMQNRGYGGRRDDDSYPGGRRSRGSVGGPLGGIIFGQPQGPYGRGRRQPGPVVMGPRTHSAGTSEIARRSGGDSMSVYDASAFEDTLARLRQRYALHFHLPPDVKPGQERAIEVELASAARQRYPDAEVRYRRVYYAGTPGSGSTASDPVVASRAPVGSSGPAEDNPPVLRRRRAVNEDGSSTSGPAPTNSGSSSDTSSQGGWRTTDQAAPQQPAATGSSGAMDDQPSQGGWRRVKPGEQP